MLKKIHRIVVRSFIVATNGALYRSLRRKWSIVEKIVHRIFAKVASASYQVIIMVSGFGAGVLVLGNYNGISMGTRRVVLKEVEFQGVSSG